MKYGTSTYNLADRNLDQNETFLSGDLSGNDGTNFTSRSDNSYHIITCSVVDASAVLNGFTITKGNANEYTGNRDSGGGMFSFFSSPTIMKCIFRENKAYYGGGLYNIGDGPELTDCLFTRNRSDDYGGGIFNDFSAPILNNCSFSWNESLDHGGGIYNDESNPSMVNCTFNNNTAGDYGGGMYNDYSEPIIESCILMYNRAENGGALYSYHSESKMRLCTIADNLSRYCGAGIYNYYDNSLIKNCVFNNNAVISNSGSDTFGGGAIYNSNSDPYIYSCSFNNNSVYIDYSTLTGRGGGCYNENNSSPSIINCIFQENSAEYGGGVYCEGVCKVINNIFYCNHANQGAGGLYYDDWGFYVWNCIFWGNVSKNTYQQISSGTNVGYCCVQGGYTGSGNISDNPMFIDPDGPDNIPGTEDDNFHLASGSPCIDAGDNTAVPADTHDLDDDGDTTELIPWDFEQQPRFYDDPDVTDTGNGTPPIIDMGIYEKGIGFCGDYNHPQPEGDLTGDCRVDLADVAILAAEWLTCTAPVCD